MINEFFSVFAFFVFFLEISLFVFVIYAIIVKFKEGAEEKKEDKYKNIKQ